MASQTVLNEFMKFLKRNFAKSNQLNIGQNIQNHLSDFENSIADQEITSDKEN